jgi:hypothetical protein
MLMKSRKISCIPYHNCPVSYDKLERFTVSDHSSKIGLQKEGKLGEKQR